MPKTVDLAKKVLINNKVTRFLDINTDIGQTRDRVFFAKHPEILNHVTSVNVPCAVHDGDPRELIESIRLAKKYNCVVGAHIGFPDPARFGYEPMRLSPEDMAAWLYVQVGAMQAMVRSEGLEVEHVRPHGALYTAFLNNRELAFEVARVLYKINKWTVLVGPMGGFLDEIEKEIGIRTAPEAYIGKRYHVDTMMLTSRIQEFLPPQGVMDQARQLIQQTALTTEDGNTIPVKFKTIHISPILPQAVEVAEKIGQMLIQPVSLPIADIGASGWL